ncbi:MAG: hypothetical protein A2Y89_05095 [Chloroflexi bacterium RBG_13_51_18]|nr:MAG: hypothetical protein A2Y89_05095 [Chloroflexi bacterium RBG_13_51_18]
MRQFIPVLMAGLALVLGGCTTTTDGDGNDVDTQAFYPNDEDNYWTYTVTSDPVEYEEDWTIIDDPGYQLCYSQQRMRSHVEGDPDDTNVETFFTDDETEAVIVEGYMAYDEGDLDWLFMFEDDPWTKLRWQSDGLDEGDTWDAWLISGIPPGIFGFEDAPADSIGFDIEAEVFGTNDFDYQGNTLTSYEIRFTGDVIFEVDDVDPEEWDRYEWRQDMYFVPEFGWVMIQMYTNIWGSLVPDDFYTLTDTNVPIPD